MQYNNNNYKWKPQIITGVPGVGEIPGISEIKPVPEVKPVAKVTTWSDLEKAYDYAKKDPYTKNFIANYNDPEELNSYLDALVNRKAVSKEFGDTWGTISTISGTVAVISFVAAAALAAAAFFTGGATAPAAGAAAKTGISAALGTAAGVATKVGAVASIPAVPAATKVTWDYTVQPIIHGKPEQALVNNLINLGETMDFAANPVKGLAIEGPQGFLKATGLTNEGRVNYDYDTGFVLTDILLEYISDPMTWLELPAGIIKHITKKQIVENALEILTKNLDDTAQSIGKVVNDSAKKKALKKLKATIGRLVEDTTQAYNTGTLKKESIASKLLQIDFSNKQLTAEQTKALTEHVQREIYDQLELYLKTIITDASDIDIQNILKKSGRNVLKTDAGVNVLTDIQLDRLATDTIKAINKVTDMTDTVQKFMVRNALVTPTVGLGLDILKYFENPLLEWASKNLLRHLKKLKYFDQELGLKDLTKYESFKNTLIKTQAYCLEAVDETANVSEATSNSFYRLIRSQFARDSALIEQALAEHAGKPIEQAAAIDALIQQLYGVDYKAYLQLIEQINIEEGDIYLKYVQKAQDVQKTLITTSLNVGVDNTLVNTNAHTYAQHTINSYVTRSKEMLDRISQLSKANLQNNPGKLVEVIYEFKQSDQALNAAFMQDPDYWAFVTSLADGGELNNIFENFIRMSESETKRKILALFKEYEDDLINQRAKEYEKLYNALDTLAEKDYNEIYRGQAPVIEYEPRKIGEYRRVYGSPEYLKEMHGDKTLVYDSPQGTYTTVLERLHTVQMPKHRWQYLELPKSEWEPPHQSINSAKERPLLDEKRAARSAEQARERALKEYKRDPETIKHLYTEAKQAIIDTNETFKAQLNILKESAESYKQLKTLYSNVDNLMIPKIDGVNDKQLRKAILYHMLNTDSTVIDVLDNYDNSVARLFYNVNSLFEDKGLIITRYPELCTQITMIYKDYLNSLQNLGVTSIKNNTVTDFITRSKRAIASITTNFDKDYIPHQLSTFETMLNSMHEIIQLSKNAEELSGLSNVKYMFANENTIFSKAFKRELLDNDLIMYAKRRAKTTTLFNIPTDTPQYLIEQMMTLGNKINNSIEQFIKYNLQISETQQKLIAEVFEQLQKFISKNDTSVYNQFRYFNTITDPRTQLACIMQLRKASQIERTTAQIFNEQYKTILKQIPDITDAEKDLFKRLVNKPSDFYNIEGATWDSMRAIAHTAETSLNDTLLKVIGAYDAINSTTKQMVNNFESLRKLYAANQMDYAKMFQMNRYAKIAKRFANALDWFTTRYNQLKDNELIKTRLAEYRSIVAGIQKAATDTQNRLDYNNILDQLEQYLEGTLQFENEAKFQKEFWEPLEALQKEMNDYVREYNTGLWRHVMGLNDIISDTSEEFRREGIIQPLSSTYISQDGRYTFVYTYDTYKFDSEAYAARKKVWNNDLTIKWIQDPSNQSVSTFRERFIKEHGPRPKSLDLDADTRIKLRKRSKTNTSIEEAFEAHYNGLEGKATLLLDAEIDPELQKILGKNPFNGKTLTDTTTLKELLGDKYNAVLRWFDGTGDETIVVESPNEIINSLKANPEQTLERYGKQWIDLDDPAVASELLPHAYNQQEYIERLKHTKAPVKIAPELFEKSDKALKEKIDTAIKNGATIDEILTEHYEHYIDRATAFARIRYVRNKKSFDFNELWGILKAEGYDISFEELATQLDDAFEMFKDFDDVEALKKQLTKRKRAEWDELIKLERAQYPEWIQDTAESVVIDLQSAADSRTNRDIERQIRAARKAHKAAGDVLPEHWFRQSKDPIHKAIVRYMDAIFGYNKQLAESISKSFDIANEAYKTDPAIKEFRERLTASVRAAYYSELRRDNKQAYANIKEHNKKLLEDAVRDTYGNDLVEPILNAYDTSDLLLDWDIEYATALQDLILDNQQAYSDFYYKHIVLPNQEIREDMFAQIHALNKQVYKSNMHKEVIIKLDEPIKKMQAVNKALTKATNLNNFQTMQTLFEMSSEKFERELAFRLGFITFTEDDLILDTSHNLKTHFYNFTKKIANNTKLKHVYDAANRRHWVMYTPEASLTKQGRQIRLNGRDLVRDAIDSNYDHFKVVEHLLDPDNTESQLVTAFKRLRADLEAYTGSDFATSQGEVINQNTIKSLFELNEQGTPRYMSKEVWEAFGGKVSSSGKYTIDIDTRFSKDMFNTIVYNESILGTIKSKNMLSYSVGDAANTKVMSVLYSSNFLCNAVNAVNQSQYYAKAKTEYINMFFDSAFSITGENSLYKGFTDEDLLAALQLNTDYKLLALVHDEKYGIKVREILPLSVHSIQKAKELNAVILPAQVAKDVFNTVNHRIGSEGFLKVWNRLMYIIKFGYLLSPGTWLRNAADTNLKTQIELGQEATPYRRQAKKLLNEYDRINDYITKRAKDGMLKSEALLDWFKNNPNGILNIKSYQEITDSWFKQSVSGSMVQQFLADDAWGTVTHYTSKVMDWATGDLERINRLAIYLADLDKGLDTTSALAHVAKTHFDYSFKTGVEQLLEAVFPFSTYTLRNLSYWAEALDKHPWLMRMYIDVMKPNWDLQDYTPEELAANYQVRNQILNGQLKLGEFNDKLITLKLNPSLQDAINFTANPINAMYEKLAAPIAAPLHAALGDYYNTLNLIPIAGPLINRGKQMVTKGNPAPSILNVMNTPRRTGQKTANGKWSNANLAKANEYRDKEYRVPRYRQNNILDPYYTLGKQRYNKLMYPIIDVAHDVKMKYSINVYSKIKSQATVDVHKNIRYRIKLDANRFRK